MRRGRVWIDGTGPVRRTAWLAWEAAMLFILFGGELFLTFAALRVAIWVLRGWRDFDAGPPPGPPGPQGGLPLARPRLMHLRGGRTRAPGPPMRAGLRRRAHPCRKVKSVGTR